MEPLTPRQAAAVAANVYELRTSAILEIRRAPLVSPGCFL